MAFENLNSRYRNASDKFKHEDSWLPGPVYAAEEEQKKTIKKPVPSGDDPQGPSGSVAKKGEKLKEDLDKVMDEIDSVLEENAEEFVKNYVQRGGE